MKKIPTVFRRDPEDMKHVLPEVNPDCQWVLDGEGTATRKFDGTCVLFDGMQWWARREVKPGKTAPAGFVEVEADPVTEKVVGWEPVEQAAFWKHMKPVVEAAAGQFIESGTYELCGPKVNGNPEGFEEHTLIRHDHADELTVPRDFDGLREALADFPYEGIVWHHPDGRMAKLKVRDFRRAEG